MSKKKDMSTRTLEELKKLNTKNLLAFYVAERKRNYKFLSSITCECCGDWEWEVHSKSYTEEEVKKLEEKMAIWDIYLRKVHEMLGTKEHIER